MHDNLRSAHKNMFLAVDFRIVELADLAKVD
jgi:hypothetical protein